MEDKQPDLIDGFERTSQNWTGESWTPEKSIEQFQLYGAAKRATILDQLDDALRTADTSNLRNYTRLTSLRRDLSNVHHAQRKVGR
jgi:hypothetical protein